MTPLPHNTFELTNWLRDHYPEVLKEYTAEKDAEWKKKIQGPFSEKPKTTKTITRISYLKPDGEAYRTEEFQTPTPKRAQPIPTDDDYGNLIYLAEEMGLDEDVIRSMKETKKRVGL